MNHLVVSSPVGPLHLIAHERALTGVYFRTPIALDAGPSSGRSMLERAARELDEYFAGRRRTFSVPLEATGTPFQLRVWRALSAVPFGETRSYSEIAAAIGHPRAVRAVGAANRANPHAIMVPCHRVIGADGTLTGYGGGLANKTWLLAHERLTSQFTWRSEIESSSSILKTRFNFSPV